MSTHLDRAIALRWVIALLVCVGLIAPAETTRAEETQSLVVHLNSDDVWTGQMGLGFAQRVLEDGHPVVVFLSVRAVTLANTAVPPHTEALTGKTSHEMIADVLEKGGRVFVCPSCTRQAGLSADNLVEGVEVGSKEWRDILMAPGTRVIEF